MSDPAPDTAIGGLLEHAPFPVVVTTPTGEVLGWNHQAQVLLGLGPERSGRPVDDVLPGAGALMDDRSADGGRGHTPPVSLRIGGRGEVELNAVGTRDDEGRPVVLLLAADVAARREAEQERDRLAGQVQLLARVTESLMQSLDLKESMALLAGALVPALADWVSIQARGQHDQLYDNVVRHRDPELRATARGVERVKARRNVFTEPSRLANSGTPVLVSDIAAHELAGQVPDAELRGLVEQLGMGSALAVPIPGRIGLHGSMLLVRQPGAGRFGESDRALAVEIGRRAGIALDNARLYAGQRYVATELQQSLLTAPPRLPFAQIAVRYLAAATEAQVGGDWYDAFRRAGEELVVVIGDVIGHDTRAAAAMGQLRGLLRGIGYTTPDDPDLVLTSVDHAIEGLELGTMATAVLAQLSPAEDGDGLHVRWSNAGHPAPVLLEPTGRARLLGPTRAKADLLLGIDPATTRITETGLLPCGSTLLLYTDGLVERRGESLDEGLDRLLAAVEAHAAEDLDRFCDAILRTMVPQAGEDDVALVAVRPGSQAGT